MHAHFKQREAELETSAVQAERNAERRDHAEKLKSLNERLAKSEAARLAAEKEARDIATNAFNSATPSNTAEVSKAKAEQAPRRTQDPNGEELTTFIKVHLAHMAESVDAQMPDYAQEVDFHDKPHASQMTIKNERDQLTQKFPVRLILKDEIQPQISAVRDARYGWVATATFDWKWVYKSRTGALVRGVTRDTWKIIPAADGFKIISEHSADPTTGQAKD
jgi:hypothetical protein